MHAREITRAYGVFLMKILDILVSNLERLGFPVFIYLPETGKMFRAERGITSPFTVPEIIRPALEDESKYVAYFKQGSGVVSFFFFRIKHDNEQAVIVIQDGKDGQRPAKAFSVFASAALKNRAPDAGDSSFKSFESDKLLRRELENMVGRMTDLEISISTKDARIQDLQQRLFIQNELLEKYENGTGDAEGHSAEVEFLQKLTEQKDDEIKKLRDDLRNKHDSHGSLTGEASAEIDELKKLLAERNEELEFLRLEIESGNIESDALSHKLVNYDDVLSDNDVRINDLELELEQRSEELIQAEDLNNVLKTSRNKVRKLMDGIPMPLFSVDKNFMLKNVNRASGRFAGAEKLNEMVGKECYKALYGFDKPCSWCRHAEVFQGKETADNIEIVKDGKTFKFEQHMYPLQNSENEIDEAGEHLFDMTEQTMLIGSLESCKVQIKNYKMSKLSDINEIEELKKEYSALNDSYMDLQSKFMKMKGLLERLMSEDKMSELLKSRTENTELRSKLSRTASALRNYQVSLEESRTKYSELNKKTIYQLERLINILSAKASIKKEEAEQSISFINSEIARLKKDYEKLSGGKTSQSGVNKL